MKILSAATFFLIMLCSFKSRAQSVKLTADFNSANSVITLNWNMVNNPYKTSYIILRSTDGKVWTEAAKDKTLRNYSSHDLYSFEDRFYTFGKNFYRIKISDQFGSTVVLSPIVTVTATASRGELTSTWVIYPNPVNDVLTLNYKGTAEIKGVVNIRIIDASGKVVIKYRSASIYKSIQIPLNNMNVMKRGIYTIQVTVMNELVMNKQFIKQ